MKMLKLLQWRRWWRRRTTMKEKK